MGRSQAIPKSFFGAVDPRTRIPRNNVILVGCIALAGAFLMTYERGAELLNFGALIAFMGVNLASLTHYYIRGNNRTLSNLLPPIAGFVICAAIWWNLSHAAKIAGSIWMLAGVAYGAWKTRGFQADLVNFDVPSE
jgi:amino acid transporter